MAIRGQHTLSAASLALSAHMWRITNQRRFIGVRGVAYQLFVEKLIPSMHKNETDKVSDLLTRARKKGYIPWEWIVDESRYVERVPVWRDIADFADAMEHGYRKDLWQNQPFYLQVWSEKATIGGIIRPVLQAFRVPFMVVHGYSSATVGKDAAKGSIADTRKWVVLYLGDHDPSGMDMSEVYLPRLIAEEGGDVEIRRIALVTEECSALPSYTPKRSDSRTPRYVEKYGTEAWEIDAMDPNVLRARVEATIKEYIDWDAWNHMKLIEEAEQRRMKKIAAAIREGAFSDES